MTKTGKVILCLTLILSTAVEANAGVRLKGKLSDLYGGGTKETETAPRRILPKKGDIAVLVEGDDKQHRAIAEAMIIEELRSRGYRVVDEAKMKRIKAAAARAKAAIYALEGNVAGILSLNAHYSAAATVVARVQAEYPRMNEFQLYTGTASVVLLAVTSGGTKLGGRVADGKTIGYSIDETMRKSLYEAVKNGMQQFF
ncbi:MAG: hypothetical protein IJG36_12315 [Synergistaceae bacterium]|nr:hypothetical protein [Synergistaceae bacterium]MBR0167568.1 hypothetical protein [Synergistaceae bacterium]